MLIILNRIIKRCQLLKLEEHVMPCKSSNRCQCIGQIVLKVLYNVDIKFGFHYNADLLFVFKNLRRIIPEGFDQPHKDHDIVEFLNNTIDHLQMIVLEHDKFNTDLLERYVKCYSKLYVSLIKTNPTSFILLPCCEKYSQHFFRY